MVNKDRSARLEDLLGYNTRLLPPFLEKVLKGTLVYLTFVIFSVYFTAWYIYDMPILEFNPIFVIVFTLITVLGQLPVIVVRLTLAAPNSVSAGEILSTRFVELHASVYGFYGCMFNFHICNLLFFRLAA